MSTEGQLVEKKDNGSLFALVALICLAIGAGIGAGTTAHEYNKLADKEVERVVARQTAQFKVVEVGTKNQELVWLVVDAPEGRRTFEVGKGHWYFDRFLRLKPGDVVFSQWVWLLPVDQKMNDRVYEHCQLYPWDITASSTKKPGTDGKNGL